MQRAMRVSPQQRHDAPTVSQQIGGTTPGFSPGVVTTAPVHLMPDRKKKRHGQTHISRLRHVVLIQTLELQAHTVDKQAHFPQP